MEDVAAATDSMKGRPAKVDDLFTTETAGLSDASPMRKELQAAAVEALKK